MPLQRDANADRSRLRAGVFAGELADVCRRNAGDAFGASLAVGPNTDPDGRILLVVGAPYASNEAERAGAVGLIRIPTPR